MAQTLLWVLPLVPTVTALLMLTTRDRRILATIDVGSSAVLFALTLVLAREVATGGPQALGVLRVDDLGLVFLLLLVVLTLAVSIYAVGWLRQAVEVGNMKAEIPAVLLRSHARLRRDDGRDGPRRQPRSPLDRDGRNDNHIGRPHRLSRPPARPGGGVEVHHRDDHRHLLRSPKFALTRRGIQRIA